MEKQDFILLIMSCQKYIHKILKQKSSWLLNLNKNIVYFHVIGDPSLQTNYHLDLINNILTIKTEDDYNSLPKKVIKAYEIIKNLYDFKFIFKTDDDQLLETSNFFNILLPVLNKYENVNYGGFLINNQVDHISSYYKIHPELPKNLLVKKGTYCNGRFYLLSNKAIEWLLQFKTSIEKEYFEDYAIGFYLSSDLKKDFLKLNTSFYFKDMD